MTVTATTRSTTDPTAVPELGRERHVNLSPAALYEHAIRRAEGRCRRRLRPTQM